MTPIRRLPYAFPPEDHESLSSWLNRLAIAYDISIRDLWKHLGLIREAESLPFAYGLNLTPDVARQVQVATGISSQKLASTLLRRYAGRWFNDAGLDTLRGQTQGRIAAWARTRWLYLWQSRCCPLCVGPTPGIEETPKPSINPWQVRWKLPSSVICPVHKVFLIGACPKCDCRLMTIRHDARQNYQCCHRVASHAGRPRRGQAHSAVCGVAIADMPVQAVQDAALVHTQKRLDQLLDDRTLSEVAATRLSEIRGLYSMIMYVSPLSALATSDPAVLEAFEKHVRARNDDAPRKNSSLGIRSYGSIPSEPVLTAAGLHIATSIVLSENPSVPLEAFVGATMRDAWSRSAWRQLDRFYQPPERIAEPLRQVRDHRQYAVHANLDGRTRHRSVGLARGDVDWRHVPQLAWKPLMRTLDPEWLGSGWPTHQQRFVALALARALSPELSSYAQAAEALRLPNGLASNAYTLSSMMRRSGHGRAFARWLDTACAAMAASDVLIDYDLRRSELADREIISSEDADRILSDARVRPGSGWGRIEVATWLWVTMTAGDFHLAPDHRSSALPPRRREARYRDVFLKHHLAKVERELRAYADSALSVFGLPGPLEACPAAAEGKCIVPVGASSSTV